MTHRGPFQPQTFCDSMSYCGSLALEAARDIWGPGASTVSWFSHRASIQRRALGVGAWLIALRDVLVQKKPYGTPRGV